LIGAANDSSIEIFEVKIKCAYLVVRAKACHMW
jgi:hypothetical protein